MMLSEATSPHTSFSTTGWTSSYAIDLMPAWHRLTEALPIWATDTTIAYLTVERIEDAALVQTGPKEEYHVLPRRWLGQQGQHTGHEPVRGRRRGGAHALEGARQGRQSKQRQRHAACRQQRRQACLPPDMLRVC